MTGGAHGRVTSQAGFNTACCLELQGSEAYDEPLTGAEAVLLLQAYLSYKLILKIKHTKKKASHF
jgi:hypothetical protein